MPRTGRRSEGALAIVTTKCGKGRAIGRIKLKGRASGAHLGIAHAVEAGDLIAKIDDADLRFSAAAAQLLQRRDETKAIDRVTMALVRSLLGAGKLEERLLEAAAEEGDLAFVAGALAERAGIEPTQAWDHLVDGNHGRLVLLLKMADSSRQFAASLLALFGDLVGIADLGEEIARFDSMSDAETRAGRSALQLDRAYRSALSALGGDDGQRVF